MIFLIVLSLPLSLQHDILPVLCSQIFVFGEVYLMLYLVKAKDV